MLPFVHQRSVDLTEYNQTAALNVSSGSIVSLPTSQQLGLAVDELRLPRRAVALTSVVEDLDEGALFSRRTGHPLVERVFKHQVELWTVLEEKTRGNVRRAGFEGHTVKVTTLTLLESMPLTCRSCSIVHCDLLMKADDPWNCFTLVMDTWDGFLFVTAKTK